MGYGVVYVFVVLREYYQRERITAVGSPEALKKPMEPEPFSHMHTPLANRGPTDGQQAQDG